MKLALLLMLLCRALFAGTNYVDNLVQLHIGTSTNSFENIVQLHTGTSTQYFDNVTANNLVGLTRPTFVRAATNASSLGPTVTNAAFNCSGGNYLAVIVSQRNSIGRTLSSVTCNGVSCSALIQTNTIASQGHVYIYGLASPTTGDVVATLNGTATQGFTIESLLFNGVGSTAGVNCIEQTILSGSITIPVASVATDLILDALGYQGIANNFTAGAGQTVVCNTNPGVGSISAYGSIKNGAASSTTMSWSADGTGAIMSEIGVALNGQ